jgi:hypothetical protein
MRSPARSTLVALSLMAGTAVGCRNDDQEMSGQPYACGCSFLPDQQVAEIELAVCALSTGEAMVIAEQCAEDLEAAAPQLCDCLPDTTTFCELGSCDIR